MHFSIQDPTSPSSRYRKSSKSDTNNTTLDIKKHSKSDIHRKTSRDEISLLSRDGHSSSMGEDTISYESRTLERFEREQGVHMRKFWLVILQQIIFHR